jgi:hypothetical protein
MCRKQFFFGVWGVMRNKTLKHYGVCGASLSAIFLLAACNSAPPNGRTCPDAVAIRDLAQLVDFGREEKPTAKNLVMAAKLEDVAGSCIMQPTQTVIELDLTLRGLRGPALGGKRGDFPYFIAFMDANGQILSKDNRSVALELGTAAAMTRHTETLRVTLPYTKGATNPAVKLLVGFQLSPEQLAFNRGESGEPKPIASPRATVKRSMVP